MQEIKHQIRRLAFSESNRAVLQSWEQFAMPSADDRFADLLKQLDANEDEDAHTRQQ